MQFQSSYIFLPNPYNKKPARWKDEKGVIHIETGRSVYSYIRKAFPDARCDRLDDGLFQQSFSITVEINESPVEISIISKNVGESYYVNAIAEGKTKAQIIGALELFRDALFSTEIEEDFISIISYDAISEYYCNKLYPKLNELERNLRKLLFNIYVLNFGHEYFRATTTKEMQDKAKSLIRARGGKEKQETKYVQQYFYSLEYADIQQLLFAPRWTKIDEANKAAFLKDHADLSQLSDAELREKINDISPKSDWERFFAEKFDDVNVESSIETVRPIRNSVAHCKFLGKEEYTVCDKLIRRLNRSLKKAISYTENKDFVDKNEEYLKKAFADLSTRIHELTSRFSEMFVPAVQGILELASEATKVTSQLSEQLLSAFEVSDLIGTEFKKTMGNFLHMPKIDFAGLYSKFDASLFLNQGDAEDTNEEEEKDKKEDEESEGNENA